MIQRIHEIFGKIKSDVIRNKSVTENIAGTLHY